MRTQDHRRVAGASCAATCPCAPVYTVAEALQDEQVLARDMVIERRPSRSSAACAQIGCPIKIDDVQPRYAPASRARRRYRRRCCGRCSAVPTTRSRAAARERSDARLARRPRRDATVLHAGGASDAARWTSPSPRRRSLPRRAARLARRQRAARAAGAADARRRGRLPGRLAAHARRRPAGSACTGRSAYGGRGASVVENYIFQEEMARARAPEIINRIGVNLVGPTLIHHGTDGAEAALPAEHPRRRGDLVPAVLRAQRRLRPHRAALHAPSATATSSSSTARRCGPATRSSPHWGILLARTDPAAPKAQGHQLLHRRHAQPGHHHPAAAADDRQRGVQRGVPRQRARAAPRTWSASCNQRLGDRADDAGARARHLAAPARRASHAARRADRAGAPPARATARRRRPIRWCASTWRRCSSRSSCSSCTTGAR